MSGIPANLSGQAFVRAAKNIPGIGHLKRPKRKAEIMSTQTSPYTDKQLAYSCSVIRRIRYSMYPVPIGIWEFFTLHTLVSLYAYSRQKAAELGEKIRAEVK